MVCCPISSKFFAPAVNSTEREGGRARSRPRRCRPAQPVTPTPAFIGGDLELRLHTFLILRKRSSAPRSTGSGFLEVVTSNLLQLFKKWGISSTRNGSYPHWKLVISSSGHQSHFLDACRINGLENNDFLSGIAPALSEGAQESTSHRRCKC